MKKKKTKKKHELSNPKVTNTKGITSRRKMMRVESSVTDGGGLHSLAEETPAWSLNPLKYRFTS